MAQSNVTVTLATSNVSVNETTNNVTVSSTTSNIVVSNTAVVTNSDIRTALSGGFGISYSNVSGVIATNNSEVRGLVSGTSPITYNSGTGAIGIDSAAVFSGKTTDDLTQGSTNKYFTTSGATVNTTALPEGTNLYYTNARVNAYIVDNGLDFNAEKVDDRVANLLVAGANLTYTYDDAANSLTLTQQLKTQDITEGDNLYFTDTRVHTAIGEVTDNGTVSGNITLDLASNVTHKANISGNITNISFTNAPANGYQATVILTQDATGGHELQQTYFSNWEFTDNYKTFDASPGDQNIVTVLNDGSTTYASVVGFKSGNFTTDQVPEGSTNFYFTSARANTAITDFDGVLTPSSLTATGNITTSANVNSASFTTTANATVGANLNVLGNLEVTGNINYREVEDLLVRDQTITLNFGNASANDVQIISDRSGSGDANTDIKWNETSDTWTFTNDGSTHYPIPTSTSDLAEGTNLYYTTARQNTDFDTRLGTKSTTNLAEGTNLYYTNARADARVNLQTGTNLDLSSKSTSDLSEGTNLYFTSARARGNISVGTPASASSGGALAYNSSSGEFTFTPADVQTDSEVRALVSVGTPATPSGNGALAYDNSTGVFTFTPAETQTDAEVRALLSTTTSAASGGGSLAYDSGTGVFTFAPAVPGIALTNLSVTTAGASGSGALAYDNSSGVFTFTPADITTATNATNVNITDDTSTDASHFVTLSPAASGNNALEVSSTKLSFNPSSGVLQTDHISSDSGQPLQLKGQTNGIQVDKTISSAESRIFDADTTGYGVASADLGAFSTNTSCPGFLCGLFITAGNNFGTAYDLSGSFGLYAQKEGANNAYTSMFGSSSLQNAIETTAGVNAKTSGWSQFSLTDSSSAAAFPADTYVTSIVGNQVNFSQNALKTYGASSFFVLAPGAASSTHADLRFRFSRDTANASLPFQSIEPWMSKYVGPETFSNTTLDYASYTISGTTIDAGNVVTRNSIDINSNPDSAIRTQRALLIGANATPDALSVGTTDVLPGTTTLGITVEQDGQTDFGGANTTPQMKFMMNQYTDNSIGRFTSYPPWTEFLGQSGNATVDLQYLGAPNFNYKLIGGSKDAKVATKTSDVIGRLTFNNVVPGVVSGADIFHPPASIVVRAPGSGAQANNTVGNADVHLQSTYSTSFRNGANIAGGTIPRTFLSSSEGNTVIAAKTDGKVTLRPVRDYGDEGADTTYVENRFAHELHEYHEFLGAGFLSSKAGTLVEIQPKSGETGGSANFNYDSKGDATLRISTHEANNAVKAGFDITNDQSAGNLVITQSTGATGPSDTTILQGNMTDGIDLYGIKLIKPTSVDGFAFSDLTLDTHATTKRVKIGTGALQLQQYTTTEINAIGSPARGDMYYNTTLELIVFYNGTGWRKINDAAM